MKLNLAAIFLDLGDTIMDESTEIKDTEGTTQSAELFPGMADALRQLKTEGYRLALVADSRPNTPPNVLKQHGLLDLFEYLAISEVVGSSKPDGQIFLAALNHLNIPENDYPRVMMVGNNLEREAPVRWQRYVIVFQGNDNIVLLDIVQIQRRIPGVNIGRVKYEKLRLALHTGRSSGRG